MLYYRNPQGVKEYLAPELPEAERYGLPSIGGFTNDRKIAKSWFDNGHAIVINGIRYSNQIVWISGEEEPTDG